VLTMMLSNIN